MKNLILHYKNQLEALEDGILIGEIPDGATRFSAEADKLLTEEHKNFLKICDGGCFGDVVLWSSTEILDSQERVPYNTKMYEIGQILYEPVFMDKSTGNVHFNAEKYRDMQDIDVSFMQFVQEYIFGDKYRTHIIGFQEDDDAWSAFLKAHFKSF
ncbi:hypothetical protein [Capnocytophaga sp.]|uniref:hypothetical protein n=1 Tax=Capnocytophaga sp. TaxID=44737 RepID=UPI0026DBE574|nr:hypothetical protein [Capnocytophaga sp.]MDO5106145.1 hypothetical protein [Capnocytophaga sp.]